MDIDISPLCEHWPDIEASIRRALEAVFAHLPEDSEKESDSISIVLADDALVRSLNKQYRHKDKPTNVLSFPQDDGESLGDVILAYETVAREAGEQEKSFHDHALHLAVHGTLHLLGFDHQTEEDAGAMESLEIKILAKLGIKNPYEFHDFMQE
ncbi:MAG: rRNA maturation RNase YbeY [Alphaproteobacteria bacterium]|nr:rRNA maturation RNase YbeY [Alphaproteobacteria bacterium]